MHFPFPTWETKRLLRDRIRDLSRQLTTARIQRARTRRQRDRAHLLLRRIRQDMPLPVELLDAVHDVVSESDADPLMAEATAACLLLDRQETS